MKYNEHINFYINKSNLYITKDNIGKVIKVDTTLGPEIEFGLPDLSIYNNDGSVIKATFEQNAINYLKKLNDADNVLELHQHFNLHLSNHIIEGGEYLKYFDVVKDLVLNDREVVKSLDRKEQISALLKEEFENFEKALYYDVVAGKPTKPYQCSIISTKGKWGWKYKNYIDEAFKSKFISTVSYSLENLEDFLEHHYNFYSFEKEDWLLNTKRLIDEIAGLSDNEFIKTHVYKHAVEWLQKRSYQISENEKTTKIITERQQSLFFYYINLKYKINKLPLTNYAATTLVVLNKNAPKVENTNIYKFLSNPLQHKGTPASKKLLINDLKFVKNLFLKIGNYEVADLINKDIIDSDKDETELT